MELGKKKKVCIAGAGGFIGGYLAARLLSEGWEVRCVDVKPINHWYQHHQEAENVVADLREKGACSRAAEGCEWLFNLACDMGGMGFIENNKADCMISVLINTHLLMAANEHKVARYFFASSACVYPDYLQSTTEVIALKEDSVYPAMPEDGYGWEKLFSERMCRHFQEDFGVEVRIARFHNVYGPNGSWCGGREKAPAAVCRKVLEAIGNQTHQIEVWGDGEQVRSFMYIDDCINGILKLMQSNHSEPLNIGSSDSVTINQLIDLASSFDQISIEKNYKLDAPLGVRGRSSDNTKIQEVLNWEPLISLADGLETTYRWVEQQINEKATNTER